MLLIWLQSFYLFLLFLSIISVFLRLQLKGAVLSSLGLTQNIMLHITPLRLIKK